MRSQQLLWAVLFVCALPLACVAQAQDPVAYTPTTLDGQDAVVVRAGSGGGIAHPDQGDDVTWTADKTWVLDGLVFVNEGQTLTIEPGTVVKAEPGTGAEASALVVARGGRLMADGTAEAPILFTAKEDDLSTTDDLPANARGLWGGIIVMGTAPLNTSPSVLNVEGITLNDPRNQYGGTDPEDDSGVLRYVSIRYAGTVLEEDNEINGLTLAGVGRGTTVEYVEVFNNRDDAFEFFGGTVNARYLVAAFATDDSFDLDQGYSGRGQFWFAVQNSVYADRAGEHDGGDASYGGEDATPYATPILANATYIGSGLDGAGGTALVLRDNFAGSYLNSVFTEFPGQGVYVEDRPGDDTGDSRARFEEGTLRLEGNLFFDLGGTLMAGAGSQFDGLVDNQGAFGGELANALAATNTMAALSPVKAVGRDSYGTLTLLDPRGANAALTQAPASVPADPFLEAVGYTGAFNGTNNWAASWTFIGSGGGAFPGLEIVRDAE